MLILMTPVTGLLCSGLLICVCVSLAAAASSRPGQHVSLHRRRDRRVRSTHQPAGPEAG